MQERIHDCLAPLVGDEPIAIVDFPDIRNVGDSAIWLGEVAYLKDHFGGGPAYASKMVIEPDALTRAVPTGPIFIHGGGNLGDIWPGHQRYREAVLARWKGRRVIQFPQSIHFASQDGIDRMAKSIDDHGNFTLLVRDEESLFLSTKNFNCPVLLCPDMAVCIGSQRRRGRVQFPELAMLQADKERALAGDAAVPQQDIPTEDWITESKVSMKFTKTVAVINALTQMDMMKIRLAKYDAAANARFDRGVRQLSRARAIVTDRLHVHIVSLLLGIPHAVLDNSYGKIGRFMTAFGTETDLVYRAASLSDAVDWANARAAQEV